MGRPAGGGTTGTDPVAPPGDHPLPAEDLKLDGIEGEGAAGTSFHLVQVHNAGTHTCTLSGRPQLLGTAENGQTSVLEVRTSTMAGVPDPNAIPATIEPGEIALDIETYGGCLDGRPEITYSGVRLRLPDGYGEIALRMTLNATCGISMGEWYRQAPATSPAPDRRHAYP